MKEFIEYIAEAIDKDVKDIKSSDLFRTYNEWDSLSVLNVLAIINEKYDVIIPRQEFDKLLTIEDLYKKVKGA